MHKTKYLLPFVFVYKIVLTILKIPFFIIKLNIKGFVWTSYFVYSIFKNIIKYIEYLIKLNIKGLMWTCYFIYNILKNILKFILYLINLNIKGFVWLSYLLFNFLKNIIIKIISIIPNSKNKKITSKETISKNNDVIEDIIDSKENVDIKENIVNESNQNSTEEILEQPITEKLLKKLEKEKIKTQKKIIKNRKKLDKLALKEQKFKDSLKNTKKSNKEKDEYIDKNVDISSNKKDKLKKLWNSILNIPKKIKEKIKNNNFSKHGRNKKMLEQEALLINFDGEDSEKSDVKLLYEYVAKNKDGEVIKGYFDAFSKVEVHSYLLSEGYEVYSIRTSKWIQFLHGNRSSNHTKIKTKDLVFFLTQLSTYIKAGIPLVEALRILERQFKNKNYKKIFENVVYDLTTGENFSDALIKQNNAFPKLLINMVKTSEMTGELPEVLDDMADYYTETERTRKQMITALTYPSIVFVFATGVITFIMMFVIPRFVEIYETMDASQIPSFTLAIIALSEFIQNYIIIILIILVVLIALFIYLYKNVKMFRAGCQWIAMHIPVFGQTIIYNEVTMFTKTFSSLLSHNVFITDSMEVLNKITNNEIYKMLILDTITNLAKGEKISKAFEGHWAFPLPAYEMLVTGEKTGELSEMMGKVSTYYQDLHKEAVARIKSFIEPILTVFLTGVVGVIILAVIIPMFNMYGSIQGLG